MDDGEPDKGRSRLGHRWSEGELITAVYLEIIEGELVIDQRILECQVFN